MSDEMSNWMNEVNEQVKHIMDFYLEKERWVSRSIYRLPASITNLNRNAYKPQIVSFGPYHYGEENLKPMEEHKHRALIHFLKRSNKPLQQYFLCLVGVIWQLKEAYEAVDYRWNEDTEGFMKIMILDGCFMLEILRIFTRRMEGYAANDPIFSNHGIVYVMPDIMRDMLMIENQLPMLVLQSLVKIENADTHNFKEEEYINELLFEFYNLFSYTYNKDKISKCSHVLDVFHKVLLLDTPPRKLPARQRWPGWVLEKNIPSATELHEAGIQIQKSKTRSLEDINFYRGVFCFILKLPVIVVDNITETMFLNLLAFERLHVGAGREVTNYLAFMNNIIRDSKDISLLQSCGIIQNALGRDEVVADLFNSLTKDVTIDPDSSLYRVDKEVIKYCNRPWVRWRANLVRTYFTNPWASVSVIASIFLFAFTLAQTGYTIFAYYRRP